MTEIIWAGIIIAALAVIATCLIVSDRKKHSLFPDDGFVWPEKMGDWVKKAK